jgi:AhpD family alkylhydroperoxidase
MSVLKPIGSTDETEQTKDMFADSRREFDRVLNMVRQMAHSPALLRTYLHFARAVDQTTLSARTRALIAIAVAEINACDYTLSLGMALSRRHGIEDAELDAAREGRGLDVGTDDTLRFATSILRRAGRVPHADVERLRHQGFTDQTIVEVVATVALNVFRDYFNLVAGTDIDFPVVRTRGDARLAEIP